MTRLKFKRYYFVSSILDNPFWYGHFMFPGELQIKCTFQSLLGFQKSVVMRMNLMFIIKD